MDAIESAALGLAVGLIAVLTVRYALAARTLKQSRIESESPGSEPLVRVLPSSASEPTPAPATRAAPRAKQKPKSAPVRPRKESGEFSLRIPPGDVVVRNVVAVGDVLVGAGAEVRASLQATGRVVLEERAVVDRVKAAGDVIVQRNAQASTVESEGIVRLEAGAVVQNVRARGLTRQGAA